MTGSTEQTLYLYRVETHTRTGSLGVGEGPYKQNKWMSSKQKKVVEHLQKSHETTQTPGWKDEKWEVTPLKKFSKHQHQKSPGWSHLGGFLTVEDLERWFEDTLPELLQNGWGIYRYEIKQNSIFIAKNQIAAKVHSRTRTAVPSSKTPTRKEHNEYKSSSKHNSFSNRHLGADGQPVRLDKVAKPDNTGVRSR